MEIQKVERERIKIKKMTQTEKEAIKTAMTTVKEGIAKTRDLTESESAAITLIEEAINGITVEG